jgi:hypothetical protein
MCHGLTVINVLEMGSKFFQESGFWGFRNLFPLAVEHKPRAQHSHKHMHKHAINKVFDDYFMQRLFSVLCFLER